MASDWEPYMQIPVSEYRELQTALAAANARAEAAEATVTIREEEKSIAIERIGWWQRRWEANEADLQAQRERAEAAEQSRDLTERVLVDTTEKLLAAEGERDAVAEWHDRVIDGLVIHWCLTDENKDNPEKALADLVATACDWALDPAISEAAANLRDTYKSRLADAVGLLYEYQRLIVDAAESGEHLTAIKIDIPIEVSGHEYPRQYLVDHARQGVLARIEPSATEMCEGPWNGPIGTCAHGYDSPHSLSEPNATLSDSEPPN